MKALDDALRGALVELSTVRQQRTEIAAPAAVGLPDEPRGVDGRVAD